MIYLIGGPPKCGKTTLAKKISKKFGIPWISADTLQIVARAYMNKDEVAKKFPLTTARKKYKNNDDFYNKYSDKEIVKLYTMQAKVCYDAIDMVSICEITDGNDYIIEGYQVEPKLVVKLQKQYGKQNIKAVFLAKHKVETIVEDFKKSTTPNDWIIAKTKNKETYIKIAQMIAEYSKYFSIETKKCNFKVFATDEDFNKQLNNISQSIFNQTVE